MFQSRRTKITTLLTAGDMENGGTSTKTSMFCCNSCGSSNISCDCEPIVGRVAINDNNVDNNVVTSLTSDDITTSNIACDFSTGDAVSSVWSATTMTLCFCMLTHSYLLISVFPYSGFLAMHLLSQEQEDAVSEGEAAKYAGFIASVFMIGRALTSYTWGKIADRFGRTVVLQLSFVLSAVFSILFGFSSKSFTVTLLIRFLLGCSNGIMGAVKTIASEISSNETEAKIMGLVIGMWGWGFLISPAVSGALSEPMKQYPDSQWEIINNDVVQTYPFLLPNIIGTTACVLSWLLVRCFVEETLPAENNRETLASCVVMIFQRIKSCSRNGYYRYKSVMILNSKEQTANSTKCSDGFYDSSKNTYVSTKLESKLEMVEESRSNEQQNPDNSVHETTTMRSLIAIPETRNCLAVYWGFSFVNLTVDEAFPLFCLSHVAGFGIPEKEIGTILSTCGLIFVIFQYGIYSFMFNRYGLYGSIRAGSIASAPLLFLVPLSLLLNKSAAEGELRWSTTIFLAFLLAIYRCFSLVFFSSVTIAANRTVSASQRATMNGLSVLGGSIAKALGPAFAGLLTTTSLSLFHKYASIVIFGCLGCIGCGAAVLAFFYLPDQEKVASSIVNIEESSKAGQLVPHK